MEKVIFIYYIINNFNVTYKCFYKIKSDKNA